MSRLTEFPRPKSTTTESGSFSIARHMARRSGSCISNTSVLRHPTLRRILGNSLDQTRSCIHELRFFTITRLRQMTASVMANADDAANDNVYVVTMEGWYAMRLLPSP